MATQLTYGHLLAIAATILISALNYIGVRKAGNFQLVMTTLKIVMIGVIIAAGFSATTGSWGNFGTTFLGAKGGMAGFMAALVAALWAYDGWNDLNMVSGEIRNPERSIPMALIAGVAIVAVLYIGVNAAVQYVMPAIGRGRRHPCLRPRRRRSPSVAGRAAGIRRHGALHVRDAQWHHHERRTYPICRGPRWLLLQSTGEVHPRFHTPSLALIVQAVMALFCSWGAESFRDFIESGDLLRMALLHDRRQHDLCLPRP